MAVGASFCGVFGEDRTAVGEYLLGEVAVLRRVDSVEAVRHHGDGGESMFEGGDMGSGVDAVSEAADDHGVGIVRGDRFDETVGEGESVGGGTTSTDDAERGVCVEVGVAELV